MDRALDVDAPDDRRAAHTRPARSHAAKDRLDMPPLPPMRAAVLAPYLAPAGPSQPPSTAQSPLPFPPKPSLN